MHLKKSLLALTLAGLAATSAHGAGDTHAVLVVDHSLTMWAPVEGAKWRYQAMRKVIADKITPYDGQLELGLVSFGNKSATSCGDATLLKQPAILDVTDFMSRFKRLKPKGRAPVSRALGIAANALPPSSRPAHIVLVADGADNCSADPCALAKNLNKARDDLRIHVIAFNARDGDAAKLSCIATNSNGQYIRANSKQALSSALDKLLKVASGKIPANDPLVSQAPKTAPGLEITAFTPSASPLNAPSVPRPRIGPLRLRAIKLAEIPVPRDPPLGRPVIAAQIVTGSVEPGVANPDTDKSNVAPPAPVAPKSPVATTKPQMPAPAVTTTRDNPNVTATPAKQAVTTLKPKPKRRARLTVRPTIFINPENGNGKQGIVLNAKLTTGRKAIERKINWSVYRMDNATKNKWQKIAERRAPTARFELGTGDYVVRAQFGHASAATFVPVTAGNISKTQVIFNAGGLRIVPALAFLDTPKGKTASLTLTRLGEAGDRQPATIIAPGKIVRLNAGLYQLTSKLGRVNAISTTRIVIKPGMLTDVEINHQAGVINFKLVAKSGSAPLDATRWRLLDETGKLLAKSKSANPVHVLAPGNYKLTVARNKIRYSTQFKVGVGDKKAVEIIAKP